VYRPRLADDESGSRVDFGDFVERDGWSTGMFARQHGEWTIWRRLACDGARVLVILASATQGGDRVGQIACKWF
jgi:hypothetical protein